MSVSLYNLAVELVLVTALTVPGLQQVVDLEEFEEFQEAAEQTQQERQELVDELEDYEDRYHTLLERIDVLKQSPDTLQARMELEQHLRESRRLAEKMQSVQREINALDGRLSDQRRKAFESLDEATAEVEEKLADASNEERRELVDKLNEIRQEREHYSEPLPDSPADEEVGRALSIFDRLDDPGADDMMAAADEVEDTEDRVRARLEAIEERMARLEAAQMLARRSRAFSDEERFFDESQHSGFIASNDVANSDGGDAPSDDTTDDQNNTENSGDESAGAPEDDFGDGRDGDGSGDNGQQDPGGDENTDTMPEEDEGDESFDSDREVLMESDRDPDRLGFGEGHDAGSRLEQLRRERKRLEEQARKLDEEARRLRDRAGGD